MWIKGIELRNVKSHVHTGPIEFTEGVNAVSGPTGAGKTTILESIGLALFDTLPFRSQSRFIREGESTGEIVVCIIDALDEREYHIVRPIGKRSPFVYDPQIKMQIVSGKDNVLDWLHEHLDIAPTTNLTSLFEDAVGVAQGLLTASFLESAAKRKTKFNPLLRVDDYDIVWGKLLESVHYLDQQISSQKTKIAELRGELKQLPTFQIEAKELQDLIHQDSQDLRGAEERCSKILEEKNALDDLRKNIDELQRKLGNLEQRFESTKQQIAEEQESVRAALQAQQIVHENENGYKLHESAQTLFIEIERKREVRDQLRLELGEVEKAISLADQSVTQYKESLENISKAEQQVTELKLKATEQNRLEMELKEIDQEVRNLEDATRRVEDENKRLITLTDELQKVQDGLKELEIAEKEIEEKDQQRRSLGQEEAKIQAWLEQIQDQRADLQNREKLIEDEETAECPVCLRKLEPNQVYDLREHYQDELKKLDVQETSGHERLSEIEKEQRKLNRELRAMQQKIKKLPSPVREIQLLQEIKTQRETVQHWENLVAKLIEAPGKRERIVEQLDLLGDPRSRYLVVKAEADKRAEVETKLATILEERSALLGKKTKLISSLEVYASLEDEISRTRQQLIENQTAHRLYLENAKIAETLNERQARLERLKDSETQIQGEISRNKKELEADLSIYDETRHNDLKEEIKDLEQRITTLKTQLSMRQVRLEEVAGKISYLEPLQKELEDSEKEYEQLGEMSKVLIFIRNIIRQAGPYITQAIVQRISEEADRIFSDIMNDYTFRLRWDEDYGITVEQLGNEREFSQLSGGEKTAAALAVRLALLRELSGIRVAFFDEPTAHLDEERRTNLADQITQIKGFRQLFVISHDDTFERDTHHVIRVSKVDGVSKVEVG
jgi:exonuclease SbcC